jgi:biopolymer transport protein ExbB
MNVQPVGTANSIKSEIRVREGETMLNGTKFGQQGARPWWALAVLAVLTGCAALGISTFAVAPAWAYQEGAAAPAPAAAPAGEAAPAAPAADTGAPPKKSFLKWLFDASGIFGMLIFLCSFLMIALFMMNLLHIRRDVILPPDFIEAFEQKINTKDYQGAYELAKNDESIVARVLAAGLSKLNRGYSEAIEGMQEVAEDENMALEHRLSYLALIGTISPMLGLLGTVQGMIMSFEKIANSAVSPKPSELAEGISTALVTTLEGLCVAIPAMIFFTFFKNKVARFVLEVGIISEGLMSRFASVGKKPAGGAAPAAAPAAPKENT